MHLKSCFSCWDKRFIESVVHTLCTHTSVCDMLRQCVRDVLLSADLIVTLFGKHSEEDDALTKKGDKHVVMSDCEFRTLNAAHTDLVCSELHTSFKGSSLLFSLFSFCCFITSCLILLPVSYFLFTHEEIPSQLKTSTAHVQHNSPDSS